MEDDEAALLAELRAISNRSAQSRFEDDEDARDAGNSGAPQRKYSMDPAGSVANSPSRHASPVPPIAGNQRRKSREPSPGRIASLRQSPSPARTGRRSTPSPSPRRRASPSPVARGTGGYSRQNQPPSPARNRAASPATGGDRRQLSSGKLPPTSIMDRVEAERRRTEQQLPYGIKSDLPSTFQGERGGSAEDAELLAELRKISSIPDTFLEEQEQMPQPPPAASTPPRPSRNMRRQSSGSARNKSARSMSDDGADDALAPSPLRQNRGEKANSPVPMTESSVGYGLKSSLPNTFNGERGGPAEDEELLAELRAISAKSGTAGRFVSSEDDDADTPSPFAVKSRESPAKPASTTKRDSTPPWKRKNESAAAAKKSEKQHGAYVSMAAPFPASQGSGFRSELPNTFKGERGGAAEDEELLAELRAISNKVGATNRFATSSDDDDVVETEQARHLTAPQKNPPRSRVSKRASPSPIRKASPSPVTKKKAPAAAVSESAAGYGLVSSLPDTFKGERGGAAEDDELLAELRAISDKSGAANRFATSSDDDDVAETEVALPLTAPRKTPPRSRASKRASPSPIRKASPSPATKKKTPPAAVSGSAAGYGLVSSLPNTFKGERGGAAEDEELLAELRAISARSGAAGRFATVEEDNDQDAIAQSPAPGPKNKTLPKPKSRQEPGDLPSRKQKGTGANNESPIRNPPAAISESSVGYGLKSSLPNTFKGDRGGTAEDEELLAELRAISSSSSAATRFRSGDEEAQEAPKSVSRPSPARNGGKATAREKSPTPTPKLAESISYGIKSSLPSNGDRGGSAEDEELLAELRAISNKSSASDRFATEDGVDSEPTSEPRPPTTKPSTHNKRDSTPPWKRKGSGTNKGVKPPQPGNDKSSRISPAKPVSESEGIKSSLPNTFQGERGGPAEDAELLAELRAISAGSASSRFASDDDEGAADAQSAPIKTTASRRPHAARATPPRSRASPPPPVSATIDSDEEVVAEKDLPAALASKNWKVRVQAYVLLSQLVSSRIRDDDDLGTVDGNAILNNLDGLAPSMAEDANAGALDKALEFLIVYADCCIGAAEADQATAVTKSLVKKNALSSRPTTLKLATDLALKLMEVGSTGSASVHGVIEVLIAEGLKSKKPKVVLASVSLIHAAALEFGVGTLPLHLVEPVLPQILSNPNANIRETGLNILAEMCRALSKNSFQKIIDSIKPAQVSELDKLLDSQPHASAPQRRLRGAGPLVDGEDVPLPPTAEDLEAQRFAARPAVDLIAILPKTEYPSRIENQKWSEKVAALKAVLEAAGEKPYKLVQPSPSVNYITLISKMKQLLQHTHYAVVSGAMEVLAMLAEGVGEKLFPHLRPVFSILLAFSKDKKLIKSVASTLDSFFGNVLSFDHILEKDDAVPAAVNEKKQKGAIVRSSSLEFVVRSISRNGRAGPRSDLTSDHVSALLKLATHKLDDADAGVRNEAMNIFLALKELNPDFSHLVNSSLESLQTTNTRAYKALTGDTAGTPVKGVKGTPATNDQPASPRRAAPVVVKALSPESPVAEREPPRRQPAIRSRPAPKTLAPGGSAKTPGVKEAPRKAVAASSAPSVPPSPEMDDCLEHVSQLGVPGWDDSEDDGGVLAGLSASKWQHKVNSIKVLSELIETGQVDAYSKDVAKNSGSILRVVKEHTRGFKESNVQIMKSILILFLEVCRYHESAEIPLMDWAVADGVTAAITKIQDKKLSEPCCQLLSGLCVVSHPVHVIQRAIAEVEPVKSPVAHEHFLQWFTSFCQDFGAKTLGQNISDTTRWLLEEAGNSSPKVKKEALTAISELHKQVGPLFKALLLQLSGGKNQTMLEQSCDSSPHEPNEISCERPKRSIALLDKGDSGGENEEGGALVLDLPKTDLGTSLDDSVISRLNSKEGKTAWKIRKEAIEEVSTALNGCNGLIDSSTAKLKFLVELSRALRERMTDTQINLRPLAARTMGDFFSKTEQSSQGRLGKIMFPSLVNASMHDIKIPTRSAAIEAIRCGVKTPSLQGGKPNQESLEALFSSFINEFNDTALRSTGLADLLTCLQSYVEHLPNFMEIAATQGSTLGEKFASVLIDCLTSSKAEVRNAAFSLLERSIECGVISTSVCHQMVDVMKPAKQRTVAPIIAKLQKPGVSSPGGKENVPSEEPVVSKPPPAASRSLSKLPASQKPAMKQEQRVPSRSRSRGSIQQQLPPQSRKPVQQPAASGHSSESPDHPLLSRSARNTQVKPVAWPQFPEEPNNSMIGNLKRAWSTLLPSPSANALFPPGGIKKQDDAQGGCELLEQALADDSKGSFEAIESQLEYVLKWISFVLCCKEATVGLQALLSLIQKLFGFLIQHNRNLTEDDTVILVPFILEKSGNAKGRFRDTFMDIVEQMKDHALLSPKLLGPVACLQVIERSNTAKARTLAFFVARDCVIAAGLPGIGKKGSVATAKALSEERLPETREAALDLMEEILLRMNGDINRLAKICGPTLNDKAKEAVEERWKKNASRKEVPPPANAVPPRVPAPVSADPLTAETATTSNDVPDKPPGLERSAVIRDELPAFNLRDATLSANKAAHHPAELPVEPEPSSTASETTLLAPPGDDSPKPDPVPGSLAVREFSSSAFTEEHTKRSEPGLGLAFSRLVKVSSSVAAYDEYDQHTKRSKQGLALVERLAEDADETALVLSSSDVGDSQSIRSTNVDSANALGTAASLRARLLKIKEKNRAAESEKSESRIDHELDDFTAVSTQGDGREEYKRVVNHVKALLRRSTPLRDDDADILTTTKSLKKVHTALSSNADKRPDGLTPLKTVLVENLSGLISHLISVIRFSLDCLEPEKTAGISIALLSVSLATLMALFRFQDVSNNVAQDDLTNLIRETATILLDPRFSSESELDDATCAQMAKAINKTAVNAATGAPRHTAFQALIAVQQRLGLEASETSSEHAKDFNGRLSRVISRLFARVIKAEEAMDSPYSSSSIDMESVVCTMEDTLEGCKINEENSDACREMISRLAESIAKTQRGFSSLRETMELAGISATESSLAELIVSLSPEDLPANEVPSSSLKQIEAVDTTKKGSSVAELVTALGNAPKEGPDRDFALSNLRRYQEVNGSEELNAHLEEVSPAFRRFIEEQLGIAVLSPKNSEVSEASNSMSERLKQLRNRLQANEVGGNGEAPKARPPPLTIISTTSSAGSIRASRLAQPSPRTSRLAQPSASKARTPSPVKPTRSSAAESLRQRLAKSSATSTDGSGRTTAAANLRARLEAVKQGKK